MRADDGLAADIYALGAVLYHAVTGRPPFGDGPPARFSRSRSATRKPSRLVDKAIPIDLETILRKCLEKEPSRRYPTGADLERFLSGEEIRARRPPLPERAWRWTGRKRRPLRMTATFRGLALAVVSVMWMSRESSLEHDVRARLDRPVYIGDDLDVIETRLRQLVAIGSASQVDTLRHEVARRFRRMARLRRRAIATGRS